MLDRAQEWAALIRTGHLPRHLTWQSLNTAILKTLTFPLPSTTLTQEQCKQIMRPIIRAGLSGSGTMNSLPRILVNAPIMYHGYALPELYVEQGILHIQKIMKFCNSKALTGELLRCSVEQHKLELGLPGPFFTNDYKLLGHLATATWVKHTWKFLSQHNIQLLDTTADIPPRCANDTPLMQAFIHAGYRNNDLRRLNLCRLFLQAATVADLLTVDG